MDGLELRSRAKQELMAIKTIEQGRDCLNKLKSIETYVKAERMDAEMHIIVAEQKLRTQRIIGVLIKQGQQRGEIANRETNMGNQYTVLCNESLHSKP